MSFFFFYYSGDHRVLHSFPTRRSSDLGTAAQLFVRGGNDFHLTGAKTFADTSIIDSYSLYYNDSWKIRPTLTLNYGDRKSTRLNSSHTVISYAVFCLKKKKKQISKTQL